ncbi:MAG: tetratricopeptide repeat protein, partial [Bacteroidales bacterium]|nr:tetratricopeptide repeat protein [Bacteroidales bacterium]
NDQLSWEEKNPEWQELFEESKIRDKLAEFTNMQMEGSDVFMSTFANLKSFPFFQHLAHWFLPFNKKYLLPTDDNLADIKMLEFLNLLMITPYLCNSDKYSFCYSVIQLPNQFRIISTTQFKIESAEIQKLENEENLLHGPKVAQYVVKQYIQDLYRFFKLHPERNQFIDIFSLPLSFHKTSSLSQIISDTESLRKFGELYFSKNFFSHAETIFTQLTQRDSTDNEIYEKIGYCRQMASDFEGALAAYLQSDIIRPDKPWTMQRIAMCYRRLKQPEKALEYYRMLERLTPENLSLQLNIGHCYFEQHAYAEALNCYYRVEFADEKQTRTMRPIAWTSFLMGKVDIAKRYYNAILDDKPTVQDYMNAGHVEWLLGNRRETIRLYKLAISLSDGNEIIFTTDFEKDIPDLIAAGIDKSEINLLIDELFYEFYE